MTALARRRTMFAALTAVMLAGLFTIATPAPVDASISSTERAVIHWMNADRQAAGLRPLVGWGRLYSLAELRAQRMASANVMSHTISGNLASQLSNAGIRYYSKGENVAYTSQYSGLDAARSIYRMWRASSIHRAQMMSRKFNYVGIGLAYRSSNGRTFASLVFTESPDRTPPIARVTGAEPKGGDITWTWAGSDFRLQTHTSGLRDFDVQLRIDSGSWHHIRNNTTSRTLTLVGERGAHTYRLRVRARDWAGNLAPWSAEVRVSLP